MSGRTGLHHLRAGGVSLVLDVADGRLPVVVHWGTDLGELTDAELHALALGVAPQPFGYPVDGPMPVSVLPEASTGWPGVRGVAGHRAGAAPSTRFAVTAVERDERPAPWASGLTVHATDDAAGLDLRLEIEQAHTGLLRLRAAITSRAGDVYDLAGVLPALPVPARATELLDFTGHQLRERAPQRQPFAHGTHERSGHRGRPGFDSGFLLCAGEPGFGARSGEVWGVHPGWSGNQRMLAERSHHGVSLLAAGELLEPGEVRLGPDESYVSPWTYATYGVGLDDAGARVHDWLRARPEHPRSPRPVVVNTWEAVTFDHSLDRLTALADAAAEVGAERFVLDDGWFGARRDDSTGLGDWTVARDVYPDGLWPLVDHVRALGMDVGLWVEPEMVNPDSDLARAHPEWVLTGAGGRLPGAARNQQVLDLADPGAFDHVLVRLDALLAEYPIACLKWDHNREVGEAGLPPSGRGAVHAQTHAVLRLMDTLRARHPGLEIETCASGGGRVDLGILQHTDRVWASDSTDAHERTAIQRWTSLLVPYELLGAHVSAPVAPTSDRALPLDFRCAVALFGHFGIEWDVTEADAAERRRLAEWVALFQERRALLHSGRVVHADVPDPAYDLHGVVAHDGSEALYAWVCTASSDTWPPPPVRLPGLSADRTYRVALDGPVRELDGIAARWGVPLPWVEAGGAVLPGRVLGEVGLAMPVLFPDRAVLLRVTPAG
ncbi:alpha-galactosidase [Isoptericola sp. S6320L]|uniref:alpha-galactosidase n=1 Tax=Isoptericola sp. S6320L TaxID=2926411 RepID=UPI001FF1B7CB|nr:alpha-galactosidase [Isoptericola sp. S6320L]MCK0116197.1 alpha-galactosidase [Isoptericola sp. S6320L]